MKILKPSSSPKKGEATVSGFSFLQRGDEGFLLIHRKIIIGKP